MGVGKLYIEIGVVMVLGMMWLSMPIRPTLASTPASSEAWHTPCWTKIERCVNSTFNETSLLDLFQPTYNTTHVLCCSVVQDQVKTEKDCFCGGARALADISLLYSKGMNDWLSVCNVTSPVKTLCSGAFGRQVGWAMLISIIFIVGTTFALN